MAKKVKKDKLINQIMKKVELVLDTHGLPYVAWQDVSGKQVHPLEADEVTHLIRRVFMSEGEKFPTDHIMSGVKKELAFHAIEIGQIRSIATRVGHYQGDIYYDLGKPGVIKISKKKIELVEDPEILFRTSPLTGSLPMPDFSAPNAAKRIIKYINVKDEDRVLALSWVMSLFMPRGTYPIFAISGKQGSAKSTTLEMMKKILDPSEVPMISMPKTEEALFIASRSYKMMPIDNVSKIGSNMSDAMCLIASKGSYATRTHYTNTGLTVLEGHSLMSLNGIGMEISKPDLLSRTLMIEAPPLDGKHVSTEQLLAGFNKDHPQILGSILQGVQVALKRYDKVTAHGTHRMADLINWSIAWAPFFGFKEKLIEKRLLNNWKKGQQHGLAADRFSTPFIDFIKKQKKWKGTTTELLADLEKYAEAADLGVNFWPSSAVGLGKRLAMYQDALKERGVLISYGRDKNGTQLIIIYKD